MNLLHVHATLFNLTATDGNVDGSTQNVGYDRNTVPLVIANTGIEYFLQNKQLDVLKIDPFNAGGAANLAAGVRMLICIKT